MKLMCKVLPMAVLALIAGGCVFSGAEESATRVNAKNDKTDNPVVIIETSMGTIEAELWPDKAPRTVENFLGYVDKGFYDGLIFHRVIKGFMIQGGGMKPDMSQPATGGPVVNEASPSVPNARGTLAMARTSDPHSATAQFFINHADNAFLNQTGKDVRGYGYAVFGRVVAGMDVVDRIAEVRTGRAGYHDDVPLEQVVIKSIRRKEPAK